MAAADVYTLLSTDAIDPAALLARVQQPRSGGVVLFLGNVREFSEGRPVTRLEYEAYPAMASKKLAEVAAAAADRWPLHAVAVQHRLGVLELGETAVGVAVAAAHRAEAFEAAQWLMAAIKETVPIWKKEHWADGMPATWVHPG